MCSLSEGPSRIIEPWRVNVFVNLFSWHIIFRGILDIFAHPLIINVSKVPSRRCDWEVKRECNQYIGIYTSSFLLQNDDSRRVNNYSKDAVSTQAIFGTGLRLLLKTVCMLCGSAS